ncbi:MAG: hypothetical protein Q4E88_06920 [Coriobacteriia bacterium]|nr:hypothetical protein [Coriobacteriia bacterium]
MAIFRLTFAGAIPELNKLIWDGELTKAYDLISEQIPAYPLYFKDHCVAYYPDKIKDYELSIATGLYL